MTSPDTITSDEKLASDTYEWDSPPVVRVNWRTMMARAAKIRANAAARHSAKIAEAEELETQAHDIAKQSGDLGYLS